MDSVGTISLDLGLNTAPFKQQLAGVQHSVSGSGGSGGGLMGSFMGLGKVMAAVFAAKAVGTFIKSTIDLGSSLNEVQNLVNVTFGKNAGVINDFSKSAVTNFGLSEFAAKKMTGSMGAMLKSSGLKGQAADMSMTLAGLSGDFASFYDFKDPMDAFDAIRSGISGETEPLKRLGINLNVANLESYALSQGIRKAYSEMSQGEQTLLRYNYLLSVTKDAQGDFARTSGSWANQTRLLSLQWDSLKAAIGQGFINMLTPVIKAINTLMPKLIALGELFRDVMASIFGDAGSTLDSVAVSTEETGDGMDDLAGGLKKAGKAAKNNLLPFDKLNKLTKDLGSSAGGGGGGSVTKITKGTKEAAGESKNLNEGFLRLKETIERVLKVFKDIWDTVVRIGKIVWDSGLKKFFEDLWTTSKNLWDTLKNVGKLLDDFYVWAGGDGKFIEGVAASIGRAFGWVGGALKDISQLLEDMTGGNWSAVGQKLGEMFTPLIDNMYSARKLWNDFALFMNGRFGSGTVPYWDGPGESRTDPSRTHSTEYSNWDGSEIGNTHGGGGRSFDAPPSYTRPASRVPQMANGGIVTRPTLAIIGEKRGSPEAVIPLNKLDQMTGGGSDVVQELRQIRNMLSNLNGEPINVYIDGVLERQIAYARRANARGGKMIIPVGSV